jgi:glycolate oxidase FAD binding subunit
MAMLRPRSAAELSEVFLSAGPFDVVGLGSKSRLGRAEKPDTTLDLSAFAGVKLYEPEELILEAGAATPLSEILPMLEERNQMLAFDPPDYGHLFGMDHPGSLGGLLATGFAGSRRLKAGSVRDHVLGVSAVSGRGEIFKAGARVVKNVTGYDVPKLMAGSWGTLAAMTSVIFKVLPKPETEQTISIPGLSEDEAMNVMSLALQSSAEVSCAAHLPHESTILRLEGIAVSVAARRDALLKLLSHSAEVLSENQSQNCWANVRNLYALNARPDDVIWRISVAPMDGAAVARRIAAKTDAQFLFDWAGGLIWVAMPHADDAHAPLVRGGLSGGHAMLFRAPESVRRVVDVFQPQAAGLAALSSRVKASMDPQGKLNPCRMYKAF